MSDDDETGPDEDEIVSRETPVDDSVSPKTYRGKQRELGVREGEKQHFWRWVLQHEIGRREIWGILKDAHFDEDQFGIGPAGFPDPLMSWHSRGAQAFGYRIFLTLMRYAPDETAKMLKEHEIRIQEFDPPSRRRRA